MKNLASCKPSEFIAQTVKIKKIASKWLEETDILNIRQKAPEYFKVTENMSAEEKADIIKKNAELMKKQSMKNLSEIFDNCFEKYPEDTLAVLALSCFVEPKDVDKHTMAEYLGCFTEMMECKEVRDFFSLLASTKTKADAT